MISIGTKIHDRFSIEFKVGFVTRRKSKKNDFTVGMWMFVPSSLDITPSTYSKNDFYRDVKTNVRLITPSFILRDIVGGDAIPLHNMEKASDLLSSDPTRTSLANYIKEVKMFGAIVKSSVREETKFILKANRKDLDFLVGNYISNTRAIVEAFGALRNRINAPSVPQTAIEAYNITDEFICTVISFHVCKILKQIQRDDLVELARWLVDTKVDRGFPEFCDAYRYGNLKKVVESHLFLRVPKKRDGVLVEQAYYSLAAGLAMLFATVVAWAFQRRFGNLTWPLFLALVISYMMKDRIKELMRYYFAHRMSDRYFDNKAKMRLHGKEIGSMKEAVDFIPLSKVPQDVMAIRNAAPMFSSLGRTDENVLLYRKAVKIDRAKLVEGSDYNFSGVNDIIRLQVNSFLRKMDNPTSVVDTVDVDGKVVGIDCPKYYYINVVLQYHYDDVTDYKHFRISLTRDGIKNIEEL